MDVVYVGIDVSKDRLERGAGVAIQREEATARRVAG
jgi:hypothetical protein